MNTLISVPLVVLSNYSKAKRFKRDVIGNSLKVDLDDKSLLQSQAMAWIARYENFDKDLYVLAALVCARRLGNADNMLDKIVSNGGGVEKCKPNFVTCTLKSDWQVKALTLTRRDLTGTIPPEIGYLASLKELDLKQNKLVGSLPSTIGALTRSEVRCEQEV